MTTTTIDRATAGLPSLAERRHLRAVLRPFRTPVRGHAFAAAPPGAPGLEPGVAARLTREPHNPADPLAVAVWLDGAPHRRWRIGYLDRGVAARVAPRLDDGLPLRARIDGWVAEPDGRWRRPVVLVLPEGPAAAGRQALWGRPPGSTRRPVRG